MLTARTFVFHHMGNFVMLIHNIYCILITWRLLLDHSLLLSISQYGNYAITHICIYSPHQLNYANENIDGELENENIAI